MELCFHSTISLNPNSPIRRFPCLITDKGHVPQLSSRAGSGTDHDMRGQSVKKSLRSRGSIRQSPDVYRPSLHEYFVRLESCGTFSVVS